jgi:hypothetical protein
MQDDVTAPIYTADLGTPHNNNTFYSSQQNSSNTSTTYINDLYRLSVTTTALPTHRFTE